MTKSELIEIITAKQKHLPARDVELALKQILEIMSDALSQGERITSISGSSRYFAGGAIVYSNELKTEFADVPAKLIKEHGAVSREVALSMAQGIRKRCGARIGLAVTGVAGPSGGTAEKPVGLVFHAIADDESTDVVERRFPGDRERVRWWASQQALDMVRRKLM